MRKKRMTPTERGCLVRMGKIYFYGEMADKVERAINVSGMTPEKWVERAIRSYAKHLKEKHD